MAKYKESGKIDKLAFLDNAAMRKALESGKINSMNFSPVGNAPAPEMNPHYQKAKNERVIKGPINTFIIMGKDRNIGPESGYGGLGYTGCSAIDIVAGLGGSTILPSTRYGNVALTPKNFRDDASRIYLSQMTNIDKYFNIPEIATSFKGKKITLEDSTGTAGIGIKSDNVRIIARENIKIVTFHGGFNTLARRSKNNGIDIIAGVNAVSGNPSLSVQPMVKGKNLVECLQALIRKIINVEAELSTFMETQSKINNSIHTHQHVTGAPTTPTSQMMCGAEDIALKMKPLVDTIPDMIKNMISQSAFPAMYFNIGHPKSILSKFNKVN